MSGLNPNRYPVDLSGTAASNLVVDEAVTLQSKKVRVFAPRNGPFFTTGLVITDLSTNQALQPNQYKCLYLVAPASALAGVAVFSLIAITDQTVGTNLKCTYQSIGGDFVQGFDTITAMIDALSSDSRPVSWDNVLNRDDVFVPTQHLHPAGETMGWEYLASALQTLSLTLLLGDTYKKDFVLRYLDTALTNSNAANAALLGTGSAFAQHVSDTNAHDVDKVVLGLANVENYAVATAQEAMEGTRSDLYVTTDVLAAVVQNAVDGGMDAHIGNHANPHATTAAQVGLGNVRNYAEALAADFTSVDPDNKKYVTNASLAAWLTSALAGFNATYTASLGVIDGRITAANAAATTASSQAVAATAAAATATTNTASAVTAADAAKDQALLNAAAVTTAQTAAQALITQYVAAAVTAADAAGYSRGYADGIAH